MSVELFRIIVKVPLSDRKISYNAPSIFIGSCFTENMGDKLLWYKLPVVINPFGITYNPLSVKSNLENIMKVKKYAFQDLAFHNGIYFSFDHHSRFSDPDPDSCLEKINTSLSTAYDTIKKASFLFLTFGTAYYYMLKSKNQLVSNCHKLPDKDFKRSRMSSEDIVLAYSELIPQLRTLNPELRIIFTVSPIRHWKDGAHENQLSKSVLLLAIEEICEIFPNCAYFPAYELMLDELRDYRFYEEDMLHPNKTAIDFIWKRFQACYFENDTSQIMNEIGKIQLSRQHRPFNTKNEVFQSFVLQQINKINQLSEQYPEIDLSAEYKYFRSFIE